MGAVGYTGAVGCTGAVGYMGAVGYIGEMGSGVHSEAVGAWCGLVLGRCVMVLGGSWDSVARLPWC